MLIDLQLSFDLFFELLQPGFDRDVLACASHSIFDGPIQPFSHPSMPRAGPSTSCRASGPIPANSTNPLLVVLIVYLISVSIDLFPEASFFPIFKFALLRKFASFWVEALIEPRQLIVLKILFRFSLCLRYAVACTWKHTFEIKINTVT